MTAPTPRASRTKVAALILQAVVRDGLPYPGSVQFRDDLGVIILDLTVEEVRSWAPVFGADLSIETDHPTVPGVFLSADTGEWNGWRVWLRGHDPNRTLGGPDIDAAVQALIDEAVES